MKTSTLRALLMTLVLLFSISYSVSAQVAISGANGITDGTSYTTLKAAFDAINLQTNQSGKNIIVTITASTTETATASLTGTATNSWTSLKIYPTTTGLTIGSNGFDGSLITLNGADNVTINGSVNGADAGKDLIISHSYITGTNSTTIQLSADACLNTIKYCVIKGSTPVSNKGVITIATASAGGNDNNLITLNDITNAGTRPLNAICSSGSTGNENSGNTYSYNDIYDFLSSNISGSSAFLLGANTTSETISYNTIRETTTLSLGSTEPRLMHISGTGTFTISNNNIGAFSWSNTSGRIFFGIYLNTTGAVTCQYNTIHDLTALNTGGSPTATPIIGIYKSGTAGTTNIDNNTLTNFSTNTANNTAAQYLKAINVEGTGIATVNNNTISNFSQSGTTSSGPVFIAIDCWASSTLTVDGNTINNLTVGNSDLWVIHIKENVANATVSNNNITALSCSSSFSSNMFAIIVPGTGTGTATLFKNFIKLDAATTGDAGKIHGMRINSSSGKTINCYNNIISLGGNANASFYGISQLGTGGTANFYFNSIYLSGSPTSTSNSSAFIGETNSATRIYRNNIFANARSQNGSSGKHYAISILGTAALTINNNDYFVSGTNGVLGSFNAVDKTTLADWKTSTTQDANSFAGNPFYTNAGGSLPANYIPTIGYTSSVAAGVTADYAGTTRTAAPTMGAYEVLNVEVWNGTLQAKYTNLKSAFDAINAGTHTGVLEIKIVGSTIETASAVLNANGSLTSLNIYPTTTGLSISGDFAFPLITLDGADNVTINGSNGGSGSGKDLTINNANTDANAAAIKFINDATTNTVKNCIIKGSSTSGSTTGVLWFSTTSGTTGNDGNTIENNNITNSGGNRPTYAISGLGTASKTNSGNIIQNNNIYDCLNPGLTSAAIQLNVNNSGWTIQNNNIYETTSFAATSSTPIYYGIWIAATTGTADNVISGNFIGGSSASCSGTWTKTNTFDNTFNAIYIYSPTASSTTSVQGNTIKGFAWGNAANASWTAISVSAGATNIGTTTPNTIGATTGTGSITLTNGTSGGTFYGIYTAAQAQLVDCQNNTIGAITTANTDATAATNFCGIYRANTNTTGFISNNLIGSSSTSNSINASSASTGNAQTVYGINNAGAATTLLTVANNTVSRMTNATTNSNDATVGLIIGFSSLTATLLNVSNNTISYLSISNSNTSATETASISGMTFLASSIKTVTGNSINNLSNSYSTFAGSIYGVYFTSTTGVNTFSNNTIYGLSATGASAGAANIIGLNCNTSTSANVVNANFIYGLSAPNSSTASIYGIRKVTGVATYSNNIINIGDNSTSNIYGFYDAGGANQTCNLFFNSIYIGGVPTSGSLNSYAIYSTLSNNNRIFRNNILYNARSNSGANGKNYAAFLNYAVTAGLTLEYNDYYAPGTGGMLGYYNSLDVNTVPLVSTFDVGSLNTNPDFAIPGGTAAVNYIPALTTLAGVTVSTLTTDYAAAARAGTPTMGAYEGSLTMAVDVYKADVLQASYYRIKDAFDKINSGAHTGVLELRVKANTNEVASAVLYQSGYLGAGGTSNYTSVKIYPTVSGLTIAGSLNSNLIDLNGADNVTIDGRVNLSGAADLTITNSTVNTSACAIRFFNSAESNVLRYCNVNSSGNNAGVGSLYFAGSTVANGNDNNTVEYCNLSNSGGNRPANVIFSSGGTGRENSGNIIRNNNIFDFFNPGLSSYGVNISFNSTDWIVSDNSFYQATTMSPTGAFTYNVIRVNTGNNHLVSNNYIGGSEPLCAGTAWTTASSTPHYFCGLFINGGTACTVQNNILKNMDYTSTEDNPWDGAFINTGNVNFTGNTIGETTGTGSIKLRAPLAVATATVTGGVITAVSLVNGGSGYTTAPIVTFSGTKTIAANVTATISGGAITGFTIIDGGTGYTSAPPSVVFDGQSNNYSTSHPILVARSGTININNNNVGSITTYGSDFYSHGLESMYVRSSATNVSIINNLVGSLSTPNSLQTSSSAASSLQKQDLFGIFSSGIGATSISGNTVCNLSNAYSGLLIARTRGIATNGGSNTITNNIVKNVSSATALSASGVSASVIGILQSAALSGTTQTISGNSIYDISNTHASARVDVYGIYYAGPTTGSHQVSQNFVHSLSISSSNVLSDMDGIVINSGAEITCANNIVNLGVGITSGYKINGIWDGTSAGNTVNFYFNSVYIGGSVSAGVTSLTAALNNANNTATRNYRNNILYNARTGGSTGKHYSVVIAGTANTTIDYNDYYYAGSVIGKIGSLEKTNLSNWKAGTSQDVNSINLNPDFATPGGTSPLDYQSTTTMAGISIPTLTADYNGIARGAIPNMGAYEGKTYTWTGVTDTDFATATNWLGGEVPPSAADILFAETPDNHCVLDQNRTLRGITNAQAVKNLVLNGKQLTLTGDLTFSNSAKIDATTATSKIVFAGIVAQSIPSGSFVDNTIDSLTINNTFGLTLNGDFTIEKGIALVAGNFAIGANTLTFNGDVTAMTGTATGGTSTNMIIGGAGASFSLPAFVLNNLTINRTAGVNLSGNLSVAGTLALTNGTLSAGANSITLYNTPTRTTGNIDASNGAASVVFANPSAITLPASVFSGNVNNLTISGAGGLTAGGDITINTVLDLQNANPSATKGSLDMLSYTLNMSEQATNTGVGDVTGIVKRENTFAGNKAYTFGNPYTSINFVNVAGSTKPTWVSCKITIGDAPSWRLAAVKRSYSFAQSGGNDRAITNLHYLDSELNGTETDETKLVFWDAYDGPTFTNNRPRGKSNNNADNNWIGLTGMAINFIATSTSLDVKQWGLSYSNVTKNTWTGNGSPSYAGDWSLPGNWDGGVPTATSEVVIPAILPIDTHGYPSNKQLPSDAICNSLEIEAGATLTVDTFTITIKGSTGAWINNGTFVPGAGTVIFANNTITNTVSISGTNNFNNLTVDANTYLQPSTASITRVAGSLIAGAGSILDFRATQNTIEYNGVDQTVINPNGATTGYHNLILSGSGTKTMPATALSVFGDLTSSGTASTTAASLITVAGNMNIGNGTTLNTGNFNHSIAGNFENNGTFNAAAGYGITMNGATAQTISGATTTEFDQLTINNAAGVSLLVNENVNNTLTLTAGNLMVGATTLGINGGISKTSGFVDVSASSSLNFGGSSALSIASNLFTNAPSINNLTLNRSGGVTLGNQNMTVNGLLDLTDGTLSVAANTLTLTGSSPTRTSGTIDASNAAATMAFANADAIVLPASIFTGNVNNFSITNGGTGGVTASSDFTINGVLSLQSVNPLDTKGSLDMWDGLVIKTLTMGSSATTIGIGDVTGIVRRTSFVANAHYSFGNEFTTISFLAGGTYPTELNAKIQIGSTPSWKPAAIKRIYDFIQTGGSGCTATISTHYLDSELNTNTEGNLEHWTFGVDPQTPIGAFEWGHSSFNDIDNWVEVANVGIGQFPSTFGKLENSLAVTAETPSVWDGSESTTWSNVDNWTPSGIPTGTSNVIIPDASTTAFSPILPSSTEIKKMTIENAGIVNSDGSPQLTINGGNGAWTNSGGIFNPGTGNVTFSSSAATFAGSSTFANLTVSTGSILWMTNESTIKIAGSVTNNGVWRTVINGATTVEYNGGAQNVVIPNSSTNRYYNLTLSGSGIKTLPNTALEIVGNLSLSGAATATTVNDLNIGANLNLANTSKLTIAPATAVAVSGTISNTVGVAGLVVKSSSEVANGSLIYHNEYNAPVLATVEMYSKAYKDVTNKWQFFGIPLRSLAKYPTFFNPSYVRKFNEAGTGSGTALDKHWIQLVNGNTLTPFTGYQVTQNVASTYSFAGELVNSDYASGKLSFTYTSPELHSEYPGQHLIGNPYTAAIDISKIEFGSDQFSIIDNTVYLYNTGSYTDWVNAGSGETSASTDGFTPGQYVAVPYQAAGAGGLPTQIPSMQAFLVRANSFNDLATVSIPYSATGTVVKNTSKQRSRNAQNPCTIIDVKGSGIGDRVWLISNSSCSHDFDNGWDGNKLLNYNYPVSNVTTKIFAMETSGDYQVNSVDNINNTYLGFQAGTNDTYTMTFTHENIESQYPALYLIDLMNNDKVTDITISGSTYSFTGTSNSVPDKRFKIVTSLGTVTTTHTILSQKLQVFSSNNTIFVQNPNAFKGELVIGDLTGKVVQKFTFEPNTITSLAMSLPAGAYIVKGKAGFETVTESVILK